MVSPFRVGRHKIGPSEAPFIIAEMSGNHEGSLQKALQIVDAAAKAGARAIKLQTYTADTMTLDIRTGDFFISEPNSLWKGTSLYQLYGKASTPWKWHKVIFDRCKKKGMIGFSTPFDASAVDFLESLDVPLYKIASFENTDLPLIKKAARTKKPLVISTGMATEKEIGEAVETARSAGCKHLVLLKCTSAYPADPSDSNLRTIPALAKRFHCLTGLSDHTCGIAASVAATALGAVMIERHLTIDRRTRGVDAAFSLEPNEFGELVRSCAIARKALGRTKYGPSPAEKNSLRFRRSLYVVEDVLRGEKFSAKNVRNIRPGYGLAPKFYEKVLGKTSSKDLKRGTAFRQEFVK